LFLFLTESFNLHFGPGFNFFASNIVFINTITEHAHNLYRMSSNLRSIDMICIIVRVARIIEDRIKLRFLLNYTS
jgi:hypothetical protein